MAIFCFSGLRREFIKNRVGLGIFRDQKMMALALLLAFFSLLSAAKCYSQTEKPPVLVTVIFAEETIVCAPNGYTNLDENQDNKRQCNPLYYDQLDKLEELGKTVADSVPPEEIALQELFQLINWYSERCTLKLPCKDPKERYAIVLAFEFQMQQTKGVKVSLRRKALEGNYPGVGEYAASGILDEGGHWINHQRADLFLPGYGVEWILTAGEHSWSLLTTK
jgi:hypothetical protein